MQIYTERVDDSVDINKLTSPDMNDIYFKQIKVKDSASDITGCGRYLSGWDGWWITYTDLKPHWGTIGDKKLTFRKNLTITDSIKDAWFCITADKNYKLYINGQFVAEDEDYQSSEVYQISSYLKKANNTLEIVAENGKLPIDRGHNKTPTALLVQGKIQLNNGKIVKIVSDGTWQVTNETGIWTKAFEFASPPLGPWGKIECKKQPVRFPANIWYRQALPPGAIGITPPVIKGDYQIYVNNQQLKSNPGQEQILFEASSNKSNVLLIKVTVKDYSDGLIEPVTVLCKPAEVKLDLWENYSLDWYSGRCVYSKKFDLPNEYVNTDTKLVLNLGQVKYCAEVWINDKLVTSQIWPPFEIEVQDYVKPGKNTISIIAANLMTNQEKWNVFDESLNTARARWTHELTILRRPEVLESGLLGPVKISPLKNISLEIPISD
jgi:hypothetical protein